MSLRDCRDELAYQLSFRKLQVAYLGLSGGVAARAVQSDRLNGLGDRGPQSGGTNAERRSHLDSCKRRGIWMGRRLRRRVWGRREEEKGSGRELALDFLGFFHLAVLQPVRSRFGRPFTARSPGNFPPNGNTEYCRAAGRSSRSPTISVRLISLLLYSLHFMDSYVLLYSKILSYISCDTRLRPVPT